MSNLRLHLVRHGETDYNAEGRIQGHLDVPLNARGEEQAEALAGELDGCRARLVISSDLRRAADTARVIAARLGLPLAVTSELRERNLGELQGKTAADLGGGAAAAGFVSRTVNDPHLHPDGGESLEEFRSRVRRWLQGVRADPPADDLIVVTHGGVMRGILLALLGSDRRDALPRIGNCAVIDVEIGPGGEARVTGERSPTTDDTHTVDEVAAG